MQSRIHHAMVDNTKNLHIIHAEAFVLYGLLGSCVLSLYR